MIGDRGMRKDILCLGRAVRYESVIEDAGAAQEAVTFMSVRILVK